MKRKGCLKLIAEVVMLCLLHSSITGPAFSANVEDVMKQLTPKQQEQVKNLSPSDLSQIKQELENREAKNGSKTEAAPSAKPAEVPPAENAVVPGVSKALEESKDAGQEPIISEIEKNYAQSMADKNSKQLVQFGYDIFQKVVGERFLLTPSIPIGPDYHINIGDKLLVTVWGNVNDTFAMEVDQRGAVALPKVGVVTLVGLSLYEARDLLYERLSKVFVTDFNIDLTIKEIGAIKIYMVGEVAKPGAYTVVANTTLYDAIFVGGGPNKNGTLRKIELVRNGRKEKSTDLYEFIMTGNKRDDVILQSGDVIRVPQIGDVIAISGNVKRPAIYELISSKTELSDFLSLAGGITPTTYLQRIQIERKKDNKMETVIDVNYADYLKTKSYNPTYLKNMDFVSIFSIEPTVRNVVFLSGCVGRPGRYELEPGMQLMDLIVKAEGLLPSAFMERAQVYRTLAGGKSEIISINLNLMKKGDAANNPVLKEFDRIRVFSKNEIEGEPRVYISGEINDGDKSLPLSEKMNISSLIFQSGGVKDSAYLDNAELMRTGPNGEVKLYNVNLRNILVNKEKKEDLLLQKNDYLFVRRIPDYGLNETVTIGGNVTYPGRYGIYPGERLSSLIERAGGYTGRAFIDGAVFIRASLKNEQQKEIALLRGSLEEKKNWELAKIPLGLPTGEAEFRALQVMKGFEYGLKKMELEIPGRLVIDLNKLKPGNYADITLQNGDSLTIPDIQVGVTVIGEVFSPGTLLYDKNMSISNYIDACGGGTEFADKDKILVLRANGRVEKNLWFFSIRPGDTILVPAQIVKLTRYEAEEPFNWNQFWANVGAGSTTMINASTALLTVYLVYKSVKP